MLIRKLLLHSVVVLALWPGFSMAGSFVKPKSSTLPCLVGNPSFSEQLIANNPKLSSRKYLPRYSVLLHGALHAKYSSEKYSLNEVTRLPSFQSLSEVIQAIVKQLDSTGNISPLLESAIYFNRFSMLYVSMKDQFFHNYVLVLGNNSEPFNAHMSFGKFPIHFGSGHTDFPFGGPLTGNMGVAKNTPAASLNLENIWDMRHKTKLRFFGFSQAVTERGFYELDKTQIGEGEKKDTQKQEELIGEKESHRKYRFGFNAFHDWKPSSKNIDRVSGGLAWVTRLPVYTEANHGKDGVDGYVHVESGPFKIKGEFTINDHKSIKRFFESEKEGSKADSRKLRESSPSVKSSKSASSHLPHRKLKNSSSNTSSRSKSRSKTREEKTFSKRIKSPIMHSTHIEGSYKFPTRKDITAVLGYTFSNSHFESGIQKYFLSSKIGLFDNLALLVGYQAYGKITEDRDNAKYKKCQWTHGIHMQLNFTI